MEKGLSPELIREEVQFCSQISGGNRVYCVVSSPGYPMFSEPFNAMLPADNHCGNVFLDNLSRVPEANRTFAEAIHECGKKAFAVFKPYEQGSGRVAPVGAPIAPYTSGWADVDGFQHGCGELLSAHPEYALPRFPYDRTLENEPVTRIEIAWLLEEAQQRTWKAEVETLPARERIPTAEELGLELY